MTDRDAFEEWESDHGQWPRAVEKNPAGGYKLMQTHLSWQAWQAACAFRDAQAQAGEDLHNLENLR